MTCDKNENYKGHTEEKRPHTPGPFPKEAEGPWLWEGLKQSQFLLGILLQLRAAWLVRKMLVLWPYSFATTKIREIFLKNSHGAMLQDWNREQNEVVLALMISLCSRRRKIVSKQRHFIQASCYLLQCWFIFKTHAFTNYPI